MNIVTRHEYHYSTEPYPLTQLYCYIYITTVCWLDVLGLTSPEVLQCLCQRPFHRHLTSLVGGVCSHLDEPELPQ